MRFTLITSILALCSGIVAQNNDWEIYMYSDRNCESDEYIFMSAVDGTEACRTWKDPNMGVGRNVNCEYYAGAGVEAERCSSRASFPVANSYRVVRGEVDMYQRYIMPLKHCDRNREKRTYQADSGCITDFPAEGYRGRTL